MLTSVCPQATKTCRSEINIKCFVFICLKEAKKPNSYKVRHHVVGMTGFEPATPRTPCVCATRLRHIPNKINGQYCRGGRIRTCALLLPKQARCPGYATPRKLRANITLNQLTSNLNKVFLYFMIY